MDATLKSLRKPAKTKGSTVGDLFNEGMGVVSKHHEPGVRSPRHTNKQVRTISVPGKIMLRGQVADLFDSSSKPIQQRRGLKGLDENARG